MKPIRVTLMEFMSLLLLLIAFRTCKQSCEKSLWQSLMLEKILSRAWMQTSKPWMSMLLWSNLCLIWPQICSKFASFQLSSFSKELTPYRRDSSSLELRPSIASLNRMQSQKMRWMLFSALCVSSFISAEYWLILENLISLFFCTVEIFSFFMASLMDLILLSCSSNLSFIWFWLLMHWLFQLFILDWSQ